jgi:SAM-dependent methyltransferase
MTLEFEWFENFFRDVAVDCWARATAPAMTTVEADFLEKSLGVPKGGRLLDIPCGHGRHALELASRGFRVTGVDLSEDALGLARQKPSSVDWVHTDMRDLSWDSLFDGAYCFGNSFAYLDYESAGEFLRALGRALKPGSRLVIDTGMAAESILPTRQQKRWFRLGDMLMLSENRYVPENSRLDIDYTFVHEGRVETRPTASYVFTVAEHRRLLNAADFVTESVCSSLEGAIYELGSPRLLLTARKRV